MRISAPNPHGTVPRPPDALSVAVLVELLRDDHSGGHVKCWERFAEAAARHADETTCLDLTVYVLGHHEHVVELSPRVRFVALRPVLSSAPVMRAVGAVDVTDLAPHHSRLAGCCLGTMSGT